jgi:hypothetical protein
LALALALALALTLELHKTGSDFHSIVSIEKRAANVKVMRGRIWHKDTPDLKYYSVSAST